MTRVIISENRFDLAGVCHVMLLGNSRDRDIVQNMSQGDSSLITDQFKLIGFCHR